MARRERKPVSGRAVIAVVAALVAIGAGGAVEFARLLPGLEQDSVNQRFERRGALSAPGLLVVAIDDKSFEELDVRWPFRRKLHAQVIRNLTRAGAKVIAYDVQFTEPDADHPGDDDKLIEAVRAQPLSVMATTEVDARTGKTRIFGGALEIGRAHV